MPTPTARHVQPDRAPPRGRARASPSCLASDRRPAPVQGGHERPSYSDRWLRILTWRERPFDAERLPDPGPSPHALAVLAAALVDARLTRRQRRAIRLVATGHTQREIARDLGCHEATASRIIARARAAIADLDPRS